MELVEYHTYRSATCKLYFTTVSSSSLFLDSQVFNSCGEFLSSTVKHGVKSGLRFKVRTAFSVAEIYASSSKLRNWSVLLWISKHA